MKGLLINSQELKIPIKIYYISKSNEVTRRIITVLAINDNSIRAYCHMRKAQRVFKLENILSCGPIGKSRAS